MRIKFNVLNYVIARHIQIRPKFATKPAESVSTNLAALFGGQSLSFRLLRRPPKFCGGLLAMTTVFFFFFGSIPAFSIVEPDLVNLLGNPSFEVAIGASNPGSPLQDGIIRGNWDNTPNRGIVVGPFASAPDGQNVLTLNESLLGPGATGCFTFQVVEDQELLSGVGEGVFVTFSALVRATGLDIGDGDDVAIQI